MQWSNATRDAEAVLETAEEDATEVYLNLMIAKRDDPQLYALGLSKLPQAQRQYDQCHARINAAKQTIITQGEYYNPLCEQQQQKIDQITGELDSINAQIEQLQVQIDNF